MELFSIIILFFELEDLARSNGKISSQNGAMSHTMKVRSTNRINTEVLSERKLSFGKANYRVQ